ncbi:MAG TPA: hypothetical protein VNC12_05315 [Solirubrobacteraceae bacterium]|nr:hypothetical protein [Solirubrobacteraceae bacterium]
MSDADRATVGVPTESASTDRSHQRSRHERTRSGWGRVALSRAEAIEVREVRHAGEVATALSSQRAAVGGVSARDGGRVSLATDVRLRRDLLAAMDPNLHRFHAQRGLVDPDRVLRSDLGRRLGLCATAS